MSGFLNKEARAPFSLHFAARAADEAAREDRRRLGIAQRHHVFKNPVASRVRRTAEERALVERARSASGKRACAASHREKTRKQGSRYTFLFAKQNEFPRYLNLWRRIGVSLCLLMGVSLGLLDCYGKEPSVLHNLLLRPAAED